MPTRILILIVCLMTWTMTSARADRTEDLYWTGTVTHVHLSKRVIGIERHGQEQSFTVQPFTRVIVNLQSAESVESIHPGDHARAVYWHDPETGRRFVLSVLEVISAGDPESNFKMYRSGYALETARRALDAAPDPASRDRLIQLGQDTRFYPVMRGWLQLELSGIRSQAAAAPNESISDVRQQRIQWMEQVIRGIDLE